MQWPVDKIERRPIGELVPYARNARTHTEAQVAQLAASMREWGWTNPVLIAEDSTPSRIERKLVVGKHIGSDLCLAPPIAAKEHPGRAPIGSVIAIDHTDCPASTISEPHRVFGRLSSPDMPA